jgi:hypothetical protein
MEWPWTPYGRLRGCPPAGLASCGSLPPLRTPHAVRLSPGIDLEFPQVVARVQLPTARSPVVRGAKHVISEGKDLINHPTMAWEREIEDPSIRVVVRWGGRRVRADEQGMAP